MNSAEIGSSLGISRERVRQMCLESGLGSLLAIRDTFREEKQKRRCLQTKARVLIRKGNSVRNSISGFKNQLKQEGDCLVWTGYRYPSGYGSWHIGRRKEYTHRISYLLNKGPIPKGLWVLHHCDNPPCVKPDHLFLGTPKDNIQDAIQKGRGIWTGYGRRRHKKDEGRPVGQPPIAPGSWRGGNF